MADDDNLFRFERLEVWQRAADMAFVLGELPIGWRNVTYIVLPNSYVPRRSQFPTT
jgi:hypothetical protein